MLQVPLSNDHGFKRPDRPVQVRAGPAGVQAERVERVVDLLKVVRRRSSEAHAYASAAKPVQPAVGGLVRVVVGRR